MRQGSEMFLSVTTDRVYTSLSDNTCCWRRLAAPRPVGPAPMTRISTLLGMSARSTADQKNRGAYICLLAMVENGDVRYVPGVLSS